MCPPALLSPPAPRPKEQRIDMAKHIWGGPGGTTHVGKGAVSPQHGAHSLAQWYSKMPEGCGSVCSSYQLYSKAGTTNRLKKGCREPDLTTNREKISKGGITFDPWHGPVMACIVLGLGKEVGLGLFSGTGAAAHGQDSQAAI